MRLPIQLYPVIFTSMMVLPAVAVPPTTCCHLPAVSEGRFSLQWNAPNQSGSAWLERSLDLQKWQPVRAIAFSSHETLTLEDVSSHGTRGHYRVSWDHQPIDTDGDGLSNMEEIVAWPNQHPLNAATQISETDGAVALESDIHFQQLAYEDLTNPELELREVKFLIAGLDENHLKIWFMNTSEHRSHSQFANRVLGFRDFLQFGYAGSSPRKYFAGTLVHRPNFTTAEGAQGIYLIESLPNDPINFEFMERIFDLVSIAAPDMNAPIAYHPTGDIQRTLLHEEEEAFTQSFIRIATDETLYASQPYQALNSGTSYGWLRVASGSSIDDIGPTDIAIFRAIPNEIGRLAGVITEAPQTPLSHVNLRARQDGIPNAYFRDASLNPDIASLAGKPVRLDVRPSGLTITEATVADVESWLDTLRPKAATLLSSDLEISEIRALADLGHVDFAAYGAKAANLAEIGKIIPEHAVTQGFAVPFSWFHEAMANSALEGWIADQLSDSRMSERTWRNHTLAEIRRQVKKVDLPEEHVDELERWRARFPVGQPLRCRSSANSEDLMAFNGAGLYDSYTHRPDEGELVKSIRQVWASLWTERAYEEREFYRIDHLSAKMGVLVHPNFDNELANGVAVAINLFTAGAPGYTINAQFGEELVTNPGIDAIPEEWLATHSDGDQWRAWTMRESSLATSDNKNALTSEEANQVAGLLRTITAHFKDVTGAVSPRFAMEVEFKITIDGDLIFKQARPWVR